MPSDESAVDDLVKIGAAAAALAVTVNALHRWERTEKVSFERRANRRYMSAVDLSKLLKERGGRRLTSARNRLQGIVIAVKRDDAMAQIDLGCGPHRVVSLMSLGGRRRA
jgi:hypothetical protein